MNSFPILSNSAGTTYPTTDTCAECGIRYDRDGDYVAFHASALLCEDQSRTRAATCDLNSLDIGLWHVRNYSKFEGSKLYIVKSLRGGHVMIFFCSTKCLRAFLNSAVDALEAGKGVNLDA
jgi:hypothetical protein